MQLDVATRICKMTARQLENALKKAGYPGCKIERINSHNIAHRYVTISVTFKDDGSFNNDAERTSNIYVGDDEAAF